MNAPRLQGQMLMFFFCLGSMAFAQKTIVINDSLAANSDPLSVKMGSQGPGKIWKFRFGDYEVLSSKMGWATGSTWGNLFNTKTDSKTTQKFSFVLGNKTSDTARVNAANHIEVQSLHEIALSPHFSWGSEEVLLHKENFSSFINLNGDTTETWAMLMNFTSGSNNNGNYEAFLTNGERKIFIVPSGGNNGKQSGFSMPAAGYEFFEDKRSLCAVQYRGSGPLGMNKNIVWIGRNLEPKMQLILASAMTAIMQFQMNELTEGK